MNDGAPNDPKSSEFSDFFLALAIFVFEIPRPWDCPMRVALFSFFSRKQFLGGGIELLNSSGYEPQQKNGCTSTVS